MDIIERRGFLDLVSRHARPGSGSGLADLMQRERVTVDWWGSVLRALQGIPCAVVGGVAVGRYAPQRHTLDLDVAIWAGDEERVASLLAAQGHARKRAHRTAVTSWQTPGGNPVDLLLLDAAWAQDALAAAQENRMGGLPVLPLPYLVLTKMAAGRMADLADIARMLGMAQGEALAEVRRVANAFLTPADREDLERLIRLGRMETWEADIRSDELQGQTARI